jgi:hypothetical protein
LVGRRREVGMILLQSPSRFLLQILQDRVLRYVAARPTIPFS